MYIYKFLFKVSFELQGILYSNINTAIAVLAYQNINICKGNTIYGVIGNI